MNDIQNKIVNVVYVAIDSDFRNIYWWPNCKRLWFLENAIKFHVLNWRE